MLVALSAAVFIGVLCCKPIVIASVASEKDETYPFDSNARINAESISSEFEPFQDDQSMIEIYDPNDEENSDFNDDLPIS